MPILKQIFSSSESASVRWLTSGSSILEAMTQTAAHWSYSSLAAMPSVSTAPTCMQLKARLRYAFKTKRKIKSNFTCFKSTFQHSNWRQYCVMLSKLEEKLSQILLVLNQLRIKSTFQNTFEILGILDIIYLCMYSA